jgi:hypothetical protein
MDGALFSSLAPSSFCFFRLTGIFLFIVLQPVSEEPNSMHSYSRNLTQPERHATKNPVRLDHIVPVEGKRQK